MDKLTHGGTPPPLWPIPRYLIHTTNQSEAYETRILALAKQIEKLSWMLEFMVEDGILDALESAWLARSH